MLSDLIKNMAMSVQQLNRHVASLLERDELLQAVLVVGEISNYKRHSSGHLYFTLKDQAAAIRCAMFRQNAQMLPFEPRDGMRVVVGGYVGVYEREGQYQFYVKSMEPDGQGQLYEQFLRLKAKLEGEGLFDLSRKRAIPAYPRRIGVVTSDTGAVIRDIIHVATRRNPGVDILLYPVHVQGDVAKTEIVQGIRHLNGLEDIDVIIIGRGGGSMEDLWAFNEEPVARAIYESRIPVISAVGHETDYTIADFVADLRAPTPSAAAELAVPNVSEQLLAVNAFRDRLQRRMSAALEQYAAKVRFFEASSAFALPSRRADQAEQQLDLLQGRLRMAIDRQLSSHENRMTVLQEKLRGMDPAQLLRRGYTYISDSITGKPIKSVRDVQMGLTGSVRFYDGKATVVFTGETE